MAGILTPVAACYGLAARGVDVLMLSLLACVGLLGAGACSLDARLFGRRESSFLARRTSAETAGDAAARGPFTRSCCRGAVLECHPRSLRTRDAMGAVTRLPSS